MYGLVRRERVWGLCSFVGLALVVLLLPVYVDLSGVSQIIDDRFSSLGNDGRISMFDIAMGMINERPLLGYGAGIYADFGEGKPHQVHNLFLGAWMQGGILCLFMAICFQLYLVTLYVKRLAFFIGEPAKICLLGILVLPLFRTQFSGSGGNFNLPEWICIAIVMALFAVAPKRAESKHQDPRMAMAVSTS